jgi:hypothetical protein
LLGVDVTVVDVFLTKLERLKAEFASLGGADGLRTLSLAVDAGVVAAVLPFAPLAVPVAAPEAAPEAALSLAVVTVGVEGTAFCEAIGVPTAVPASAVEFKSAVPLGPALVPAGVVVVVVVVVVVEVPLVSVP